MRKAFIIKSIFFLLPFLGVAQPTIRFNKQYNFGFTNGGYLTSNVFQKGNDYLLCGTGLNSTQNQNYCLGIICTDSIGTQKWQMYRNAPGNFRFSNNSGISSFQKIKDNNILFSGEIDYANGYSKSCLVKLNHLNGDTVWVKQYNQVGDTSNLFCTSQLADSGFISIGYKYWYDGINTEYNRPFILRTDKNGNYKWHKYLSNLTASIAFWYKKLINLNDKDFIVIGNNSNRRGFLLKFDTLGNIAFNKNYAVNSYSLNFFSDIITLNNGDYLVSGDVMTFHTFNFSQILKRPSLVKIDKTTGNLIVGKMYGKEIEVNTFSCLWQSTITSEIYASGEELFPPTTFKATFYKFNNNLDSVYTRYYNNPGGGEYFSENVLQTNDGGFAFPMMSYPFNGQQQFCLMKTDSMGCDSVNGCVFVDVGLSAYGNNNGFKVYPNPLIDYLIIESEFLYHHKNYSIEITDLLGRILIKTELTEYSKNKTILNVKDLNQGIYLLKILEASDKLIGIRKIIKE